jgi:hypothetical protein
MGSDPGQVAVVVGHFRITVGLAQVFAGAHIVLAPGLGGELSRG